MDGQVQQQQIQVQQLTWYGRVWAVLKKIYGYVSIFVKVVSLIGSLASIISLLTYLVFYAIQINDKIIMMNKNLEERIDSRFGEMAKKFDLFSDKISVRDREIDVINSEIAVVDGKHSATKSNIDEKIGIFKDRLDLADKQIFTIQERLKRKWGSYT